MCRACGSGSGELRSARDTEWEARTLFSKDLTAVLEFIVDNKGKAIDFGERP